MDVRLRVVDVHHGGALLVEGLEPRLGAGDVEDAPVARLGLQPAEDVEVHGVAREVVRVLVRERERRQRRDRQAHVALHRLHLVVRRGAPDRVEEAGEWQRAQGRIVRGGQRLGRAERRVGAHRGAPARVDVVVAHRLRHGPGAVARPPEPLWVDRIEDCDHALLLDQRLQLGAARGERPDRRLGVRELARVAGPEVVERLPRLGELGAQRGDLVQAREQRRVVRGRRRRSERLRPVCTDGPDRRAAVRGEEEERDAGGQGQERQSSR